MHKLSVFDPSEILVMNPALRPKSKLCAIIEEGLTGVRIIGLDRKYWAETAGLEYIQQLAFAEDVEAIKVAIGGNYFATCCIAAALKYIELVFSTSFSFHSLRITFQPPEGSMMIDLSTIRSLELIQNSQNSKSRDCLFGLLNETSTPMGSRLLRSNILQPLTDPEVLKRRFDALEELTIKEDMFFAIRQGLALKPFPDVDKLLTSLITIPTKRSLQNTEHAINDIILLKHFVDSVKPIFEALTAAKSFLLGSIRNLCSPSMVGAVQQLINEQINDDVTYQTQPLDLRNQRTYAVRSGVNGLLDVARKTYDEACQEVYQLVSRLNGNLFADVP
ncbi:MAG: MutS protein msh4 [Peltula sp. TS41687]|nr:MAG: MutS protein msh4 [Peltula sp. TS41687]